MKTLLIYLYAFLLIIGSLPKLYRARKIPNDPYPEKAQIIFQTPAEITRKIIKRTGATVTISGMERIPDQPVLFVANHQGLFDILLLLGYLKKPVGFIAKAEIKRIPIVNKWMKELKCVFIDRSDRRAALKVIDDGIENLKAGQSMVIFPEGTRGEGRELSEFKPGSLRLATRSGVPIVPLAIDGTYRIFEEKNRRIQPSNITLTVGEPIYPAQYQDKKHRELAEELQHIIGANMSTTEK